MVEFYLWLKDSGKVSKEFDTSDCGIFDEDFMVAAQRVQIISCRLFGIGWILEDEVVFHAEKRWS